MTTKNLNTLTATLPNGETVTRTTKAAYKFVVVALNPFSNKYEVQGWTSKQPKPSLAPARDASLLVRENGQLVDASVTAMFKSTRMVPTIAIAVNG